VLEARWPTTTRRPTVMLQKPTVMLWKTVML
jgi:hypothetical protein